MDVKRMVAVRTQDDKTVYTTSAPVNRAERRELNVKSKKMHIPATLNRKSNNKRMSL